MSKTPCNCHSYNWDIDEDKEEILQLPKWCGVDKKVSIDKCIAPVIKHLWEHHVYTINSCCGHNRTFPTIILGENEENYYQIRQLIKEVDDRYFELSQWRRVIV